MNIAELQAIAVAATTESDVVDFKEGFFPEKKAAFWAELVKDIVSFTNSRGGVIIFGICDDGSTSENDASSLLAFDPAKITDQIAKYTGVQFSDFDVASVDRNGQTFPAIFISSSRFPLVFTKVGTYAVSEEKQKTAFSVGTVYYRHGAKSEPAQQQDIIASFEKELTARREEWLGNIRRVVEAAPGSTVIVADGSHATGAVRLSSDPSAPVVRLNRLSETHPHTRGQVIKEVKKKIGAKKFNGHDVQCILHKESITPDTRADLVHKPHSKASPQYSEAFVELICLRIEADSDYLKSCRNNWKEAKYGGGE
ncbi:RNA-binding domain-containing protein [Jannaschia ovalis]|uniref:DNA binding domain-containing protein n=1 Tax=Jannaschia ovalis TaxID=3038773 RepID=A0ABY8LHP3_9RHOB|nr:RNA-binding domain-containing protein [Jannaschia sp. GRR-S6-38]WGH79860.1 putative DNA binding domain-containing protein [Jannaschia sp. GRR-S6-38]